MTTEKNFRLLMELRPCQEGFSGIPQETRLLFSAFRDLPGIETVGLLNHPVHSVGRSLLSSQRFDDTTIHRKYNQLSKFIVSQKGTPLDSSLKRAVATLKRELAPTALALSAAAGSELPLYEFDAGQFGDFIWETFFSKTLPPEDYAKIKDAGFRSLRTSWRALHRTGLQGIAGFRRGYYPRLATHGFDFFLAQTPYPAEVAKGTQTIVRYHDAIPIFLPHLIPQTRFHRASHYRALLANSRNAIFACTSNAVRCDLLRLLPVLEQRAVVVHDIVSHHYYAEPTTVAAVAEIIRSRLNPNTLPKSLATRDKSQLLAKEAKSGALRYLLMVSTIEPRKNHVRLVRAWERLRMKSPDLKLVIVGELGWDVDRMVDAFRPWQERRELFNLSRVPASDLRAMYAGAECVVCPSVAEGFDLSGIEAMLCGAPIMASDIEVHREIYGPVAAYFNPYSDEDLAARLETLIGAGNEEKRATLSSAGLNHARQYQRDAIAPRWTDLFDRICHGDFKPRTNATGSKSITY